MGGEITQPEGEMTAAFEKAKQQWWYDVISAGSGLILGLFMLGHTMFTATIWAGHTGFDFISGWFEKTAMAQITIIVITVLFFTHFVVASRKIPSKLTERKLMMDLGESIQTSEWRFTKEDKKELVKIRPHDESTLWLWQLRTGMVILATGSVHLALVAGDILRFTIAWMKGIEGIEGITAEGSIARDHAGMGIILVILLFAVAFHTGIGLYRLTVKWGLGARLPIIGRISRKHALFLEKAVILFMLIMGVTTVLVLSETIPPPIEWALERWG